MTTLAPFCEHVGYKLVREIVARSVADEWDAAKHEWELANVYRTPPDEPTACLCGHYPIVEVCVLRNVHTASAVEVGNVCVKKFLGLDADPVFRGLKRVAANPDAALTPEAVGFAFARGWLSEWERRFCEDTARKRRLTGRQRAKRSEINAKVLAHTGGVSDEQQSDGR